MKVALLSQGVALGFTILPFQGNYSVNFSQSLSLCSVVVLASHTPNSFDKGSISSILDERIENLREAIREIDEALAGRKKLNIQFLEQIDRESPSSLPSPSRIPHKLLCGPTLNDLLPPI